jgi:DUF1680 family protein
LQLTFESGLQKTGRSEYGDRVELIWFNAAQGARLPNGSAISYLTSDNRLHCNGNALNGNGSEIRNKFSPTHTDAAVCCNPNATQVAALFVRGMWMRHTNGSPVAMLYGPCTLSTIVHGVHVRIEEHTLYPFQSPVDFVIHPDKEIRSAIYFRNPVWSPETRLTCVGAAIRREGEYWSVEKRWRPCDSISLEFSPGIQKVPTVNGEVAVKYGALIFAEPLPSTKTVVKKYEFGNFEDSYYEPQNEALVGRLSQERVGSSTLEVEYAPNGSDPRHPFDTPLISLNGRQGPGPKGSSSRITLVPVGCTPLLRKLSFPDAID